MFYKDVSVWINGVKFLPSNLMSKLEIKFEKVIDAGSISNKKLMSKHTFGYAIIDPPKDITYDPQTDDFDRRITWLLNYLEDKIDIIKNHGADEFVLDIEYNLDIENISQKYIDSLSIDQMLKMSALGIKYEITIWPNFPETFDGRSL